MAWVSLIAGLTYPVLVLFTESAELGAIATPFYIFVSSVVGAYIGFATMDDKFQKDRYDYDGYGPPVGDTSIETKADPKRVAFEER